MRKLLVFALLFIVSLPFCSENKSADLITPIERIFPPPYFPEKQTSMLGLPLSSYSKNWFFACLYSEKNMDKVQLKFMKSLPKLQDDGVWGLSFERDFDGDGSVETVNYGAYQKKNEIGNFIVITRKQQSGIKILYLREFPEEEGHFACFYLVSQTHTILFGSNLIGGELTWILKWTKRGPEILPMGPD